MCMPSLERKNTNKKAKQNLSRQEQLKAIPNGKLVMEPLNLIKKRIVCCFNYCSGYVSFFSA